MTRQTAFTPNSYITYEQCPVCFVEDCKVEHGHKAILINDIWQETITKQHYWHCPECGNSISTVIGPCLFCDETID